MTDLKANADSELSPGEVETQAADFVTEVKMAVKEDADTIATPKEVVAILLEGKTFKGFPLAVQARVKEMLKAENLYTEAPPQKEVAAPRQVIYRIKPDYKGKAAVFAVERKEGQDNDYHRGEI